MPLFPAYAQLVVNNEQTASEEGPWSLTSSVPADVTQQTSEVSIIVRNELSSSEKHALKTTEEEKLDESSSDEEKRRRHKKKKHKESKHKSRSDEKKKKKNKDHSKSRDRKDKKHSHQEQPSSFDRKDDPPLIAKGVVFSNGLNLRPSQAFYQDTKGDKNNLAFPNLYYKYVPRYLHSYGAMGGKIVQSKFKVKKQKPPRYFGKRAIRRISKPPIHVKQEIPSDRNPLGIYDVGTVMYIQGQSAPETTDDIPVINKEEDRVKQKNAEYNKKLKQEPQNIQLWLEFIDFQDSPEAQRLVTNAIHTASKEKQLKNLHKRALLERKVSILDKAIEMNPKCVELITTKLQIASEYWEAGNLQQEWKRILFVLPMSIDLWKKYLSFTENYFEGFSVNSVLKSYSSCIQKMIQMQHPSFSSHQRPAHLEEHMIDIATRLCLFLRHTGLTEKSTSVFQAVVELGLNRLQKFHQPKEDLRTMLPILQSHWENAAPRFGEDKADVSEAKPYRLVHGTDLSDVEDSIIQSGQPHPVVWARVEQLRSLEHWQAWTPLPGSEDECDDPERSIQFPDISPYIFAVEKNSAMHFRLVTGFLQSLNVPLYPAVQAQTFWAPVASADDLAYLVSSVPSIMRLRSVAPTLLNSGPYLNWIRRIVLDAYSILPAPYKMELAIWWLHVERMRMTAIVGHPGADSGSSWKETKRWIKNFLKGISPQDVNSTLLLYSVYACVEYDAGNQEECCRVLQMVLTMHSSNPLQQTDDRKRDALIRTWFFLIRHLIRTNAREKALAHLVALGAGTHFNPQAAAPTPALLLKAKRKYESLYQQITNEPESFNEPYQSCVGHFNLPDFVVDFVACYSYFISLTEGCMPAHRTVTQLLERHKKEDMEFTMNRRFDHRFLRYHNRREMIFVNLLQLLSICPAWARDVQPRVYHDTLFTAVSEYPKSYQLLSIFIESEEQCSTFSRLWNSLVSSAKSKADDSTTVVVAACLALAKRGEIIHEAEERAWRQTTSLETPGIHPGYLNKIHHLIEHCVAQYPGRHSPLLWRTLMRLAHMKGDLERCKALYYRAARDCPWSKDVFMDVVNYVPSLVKEVAGLLLEKDLRLRFPLEELDVLLEPEPDLEVAGTGETENMDADEAVEEQGNDAEGRESDGSDDNLSEDYENEADSDV